MPRAFPFSPVGWGKAVASLRDLGREPKLELGHFTNRAAAVAGSGPEAGALQNREAAPVTANQAILLEHFDGHGDRGAASRGRARPGPARPAAPLAGSTRRGEARPRDSYPARRPRRPSHPPAGMPQGRAEVTAPRGELGGVERQVSHHLLQATWIAPITFREAASLALAQERRPSPARPDAPCPAPGVVIVTPRGPDDLGERSAAALQIMATG
jgi:hypothetical protein